MRGSVLLRIASDEPVRYWSGVGDLVVPVDAIETDAGAVYLGGANLIAIPELQQLVGGTADRLDIGISGVTAEAQRLAIDEAADVKGRALDIGVVRFGADWQIVSVTWLARYRVDKLTVTRQAGARAISLSVGSDDTGRSRSPSAYWTDAEQRRRSPTDSFFDHVAGINAGTSRPFGPK